MGSGSIRVLPERGEGAEGIYRLDDDFFLEHEAVAPGSELRFAWHGRSYGTMVPAEATLPAFLTVEGTEEPPPGDLVIVLPSAEGLRSLFRSTRFLATVTATMFPPASPPQQG
jgi:hypothetical protein